VSWKNVSPKFNKNNLKLHKRRGISTIVGGLIFLILLTTGFSAYFLALNTQIDTVEVQRKISSSLLEKTKEQFDIAVAVDESQNNLLSIQVSNKGTNPVEISNIWIINKSEANEPAKSYDVNYEDSFIPIGYGAQILEKTPLYMIPNSYDIKVVSSLGTIHKASLIVGGANHLLAEMFTIPPDVRQGENATIALRVTNVGATKISGVIPGNLLLDGALPPHAQVNTVGQVSIGPVDLNPSESTIFSWHITLEAFANIGTKVAFSNFATGTESVTGYVVTSNTASDKIIIRDPKGGSGEEIVLREELFGRPQIFMIFPGPAGIDSDDDSKGVWGVMVANPTDQDMIVSKIVILAYSPRASSSDKIFKDGCHNETNEHDVIAVPPHTTTIDWTCPENNQLVWSGATPVTIQPRSVHPFMAKIGTKSYDSGPFETGHVVVQAIVFTDLGQFGKAGYASTMQKNNIAMPNVFLSKTDNPATAATIPSNILGNITRITEGTQVVFNATIVDMSGDENSYGINIGTKLIINIPKEWIYVGITGSTGFNIIKEQVYPDGSTQIVGQTTQYIDEPDEARIIKFYATAPAVTSTKMYVMHILADGTVTGLSGTEAIGPIAEVILQVCPTTGCLP